MQPNSNLYSDRAYEADQLRIRVVIEALAWASGYFDQRLEHAAGHNVAAATAGPEKLDAAAAALAGKLAEPDHCTQCGQIVPPERASAVT